VMWKLTEHDFDTVIGVNLKGTWNLTSERRYTRPVRPVSWRSPGCGDGNSGASGSG
jgi:hypothetical protein